MALPNTFIYDPTQANAAATLTQIIEDETILLVVMGKQPLPTQVVNLGDPLAGPSSFGVDRKVIWLPDNAVEKARCQKMLSSMTTYDPAKYDQIVAFSVRPRSDNAADIIFPEELTDEFTIKMRLKRAFARAGVDLRLDS